MERSDPALSRRKYVFVAGFPRSGSTLFCNILAQNPRFRSDGVTSGLLTLLRATREQWASLPGFNRDPQPELQKRVMRGIFHAYYADTPPYISVVFDKHRGWPSELEMAETLLESRARVLVLVRDMRAIMSSWEKVWRRSKGQFHANLPLGASLAVTERVKHWSSPGEPTGYAYVSVQDALHRGFEDRMLFIDYDRLTRYPGSQMQRVYQFLGEEYFPHDFENIEQRQIEPDPEPWMRDIHVIQRSVRPGAQDWPQVLGPATTRLEEANLLWQGKV